MLKKFKVTFFKEKKLFNSVFSFGFIIPRRCVFNKMLSCFQSTLYVKEVQSDKGLSGALVELEVGVDGHRAQKIKIETKGENDDSVVLDMPEGLLVGYQVFGPQEHGDHDGYKYEKDVSVTPFKRTARLLKTVTFFSIYHSLRTYLRIV